MDQNKIYKPTNQTQEVIDSKPDAIVMKNSSVDGLQQQSSNVTTDTPKFKFPGLYIGLLIASLVPPLLLLISYITFLIGGDLAFLFAWGLILTGLLLMIWTYLIPITFIASLFLFFWSLLKGQRSKKILLYLFVAILILPLYLLHPANGSNKQSSQPTTVTTTPEYVTRVIYKPKYIPAGIRQNSEEKDSGSYSLGDDLTIETKAILKNDADSFEKLGNDVFKALPGVSYEMNKYCALYNKDINYNFAQNKCTLYATTSTGKPVISDGNSLFWEQADTVYILSLKSYKSGKVPTEKIVQTISVLLSQNDLLLFADSYSPTKVKVKNDGSTWSSSSSSGDASALNDTLVNRPYNNLVSRAIPD